MRTLPLALLTCALPWLVACDDATTAPLDFAVPLDYATPDLATSMTPTGCFGHVTKPMPSQTSYTFTLVVSDYLMKTPVANATVKVCAEADATCANPSMTGTTDASGKVTLTAPAGPFGVAGYLDLSADKYIEQLQYVMGLGYNDLLAKGNGVIQSPMFQTSTAQLVYGLLGVMADPSRGLITFAAVDCNNQPLAGVTGTTTNADGKTKTFYVAGNLPSASATMTDASGAGIVYEVPPGATELDASYMGTPYSKVGIVVRANAITALNAFPTM